VRVDGSFCCGSTAVTNAWISKDAAKGNGRLQASSAWYTQRSCAYSFRFWVKRIAAQHQINFYAPSAVAGVFARTDSQRGIWKAPPDWTRRSAEFQQLSIVLTDPEIGELNPLALTACGTLPRRAIVWGARLLP